MKKEVKKAPSFLVDVNNPRRVRSGGTIRNRIVVSQKVTSENIDELLSYLTAGNIEAAREYDLEINDVVFPITKQSDPNDPYSVELSVPSREELLNSLNIKEKKKKEKAKEEPDLSVLQKKLDAANAMIKLKEDDLKKKDQVIADAKKAIDVERRAKEKAQKEAKEKDALIKSVRDKPDKEVIDSSPEINYPELLKNYSSIKDVKQLKPGSKKDYIVQLAEYGKNNTQIFTRESDINHMIDSIGREKVLDINTTVLEPTSGDGAFTVRILQARLDRIISTALTKEEFILKSLQALSTIYSIEYEPDTVYTQRNNLYSIMHIGYEKLFKKKKIDYDPAWDELSKKIIFDNVIWGAFATKKDSDYSCYDGKLLGYDRASNRPLTIIRWDVFYDKRNKLKTRKEIIS